MAVRLRRSAPGLRRRTRTAPVLGLAALAIVATAYASLRYQPDQQQSPVRIERLRGTAAARLSAASVDASLVSMPPLAPPRPFLADHRIVAYYGNPLAEVLGVLGQDTPERIIPRLKAQADAYTALSTDRKVVPAVHLIYAVAQQYTDDDGAYLFRMSDQMVQDWIKITRDNGMILILDIQMGKSTVEKELPRIFKYLENENVHVALDPEFAWGPDGIPGDDIGHMNAAQINTAQEMLQRFTMERRLPSKILIVHQFLPGMVRDKADLRSYDRVELVIDADGVGPRHVKLGSWQRVIQDDNVKLAAIKLFYKHDPDMMQPADVLNLEPKPVIIIYQ